MDSSSVVDDGGQQQQVGSAVGVIRQEPDTAVREGHWLVLVPEGHRHDEDPGLVVGGQVGEHENQVLISRSRSCNSLSLIPDWKFLPFSVKEIWCRKEVKKESVVVSTSLLGSRTAE